jgi:hypothetical protein
MNLKSSQQGKLYLTLLHNVPSFLDTAVGNFLRQEKTNNFPVQGEHFLVLTILPQHATA